MPSNRTPTRIYGPAEPTLGTIYTVGAGKIVVIRSVQYFWNGSNELGLSVNGTEYPDDYFFYRSATLSADTTLEEWMYTVLEDGDVLSVFVDDAGVGLTINADVYDA
jgi:hypothetical protein